MIYQNSSAIFAVPNDQKITVYSSATNDMVQFYKQQPKSIFDKIKEKLNPTPEYETITSDKIQDVLKDENANIVNITKPGAVNVAFINEDNSITNGATVSLMTTASHTSDSGFWISGISQHKLNEYVLNNGVCEFDHSQQQDAVVEAPVSDVNQ